jgi:hypothetical protein
MWRPPLCQQAPRNLKRENSPFQNGTLNTVGQSRDHITPQYSLLPTSILSTGSRRNGVFWDVTPCGSCKKLVRPCGSCSIPEDAILHSQRRENLRSYRVFTSVNAFLFLTMEFWTLCIVLSFLKTWRFGDYSLSPCSAGSYSEGPNRRS